MIRTVEFKVQYYTSLTKIVTDVKSTTLSVKFSIKMYCALSKTGFLKDGDPTKYKRKVQFLHKTLLKCVQYIIEIIFDISINIQLTPHYLH